MHYLSCFAAGLLAAVRHFVKIAHFSLKAVSIAPQNCSKLLCSLPPGTCPQHGSSATAFWCLTGEWEAAVESGRVKALALDSFTMGIKTLSTGHGIRTLVSHRTWRGIDAPDLTITLQKPAFCWMIKALPSTQNVLLRHVVVWVTKMDDYTVQFDSARYEEIKKAVTAFLKEVGYKLKDTLMHQGFLLCMS